MKDNKYKIIELFVYIIIVIIGIALLIFGRAKGPETAPGPEPTAQVSVLSSERGE